MDRYCSQCHTRWRESAWDTGQKCPFKDCRGYLITAPPEGMARSTRRHDDDDDLPLLTIAEGRKRAGGHE